MLPKQIRGAGIAALLVGTAFADGPAAVDRVGPPSWWSEATDQSLTLLVEGSGLVGATVRFSEGPVRVDRVEVQTGGLALFAHLTIPGGAKPATCRLEVAVGGRGLDRRWGLVAKPIRPPHPVGPPDVIFLPPPHRLAHGPPPNN